MGLSEIRNKIDAVDGQLKELFLQRMAYIKEVLAVKKEEGLPVRHPEREQEILDRRLLDVTEFKEETRGFLKSLIDISCKYQAKGMATPIKQPRFLPISQEEFFSNVKTLCYQGIPGSYSWEAGGILFPDSNRIPVKTFYEVCNQVTKGEVDAGILPIENLAAGSVSEVYDLIEEFKLNIVCEISLPIRHCLLGTGSLDEIRKVKSHPQALSQCSKFILDKGFSQENSLNTATAAKEVAQIQDVTMGAICNANNAKLYGLNILAEDIADITKNKTRFVVVTKEPLLVGDPNKISIVFTLPNEPGSLADALQDFMAHNLNLTKIESRPVKSNQWEYLFFVDVDGSLQNESVVKYFDEIGYLFSYFRIIGCY